MTYGRDARLLNEQCALVLFFRFLFSFYDCFGRGYIPTRNRAQSLPVGRHSNRWKNFFTSAYSVIKIQTIISQHFEKNLHIKLKNM